MQHLASIDPLIALGVVVATALTDAICVMFTSSVVHRKEWDNLDLVFDPTARRYEGGTHNLAGIAAMGASIDLLTETGVDEVWTHVEELCRLAAVGLAEIGATILSDRSIDGRSAILTVSVGDLDPETLSDELARRDIICAPRGGGLRIAPHGYNTADDIDSTSATEDLCRRGPLNSDTASANLTS